MIVTTNYLISYIGFDFSQKSTYLYLEFTVGTSKFGCPRSGSLTTADFGKSKIIIRNYFCLITKFQSFNSTLSYSAFEWKKKVIVNFKKDKI